MHIPDARQIYLTTVKEKSSLGTLTAKTTQIKFEDDFDHPILNQALPRDKIEVWLTGPCFEGLEASFKVAAASMVIEKEAPKGKEKFCQVKLHSNVFCGRDTMSVERSELMANTLKYLSAEGAQVNKVVPSQQGKGEYSALATQEWEGRFLLKIKGGKTLEASS